MAQKIPANTKRTIQRLAILGSILFVIGLLMTVRDWKLGSALAKETHINIKPVDGNTYIVAEDVKKIIRDSTGQDIENIVLGNLNIRSIEEKLKSNPFVLDAEVYVDARNHIYIEIEQNEPILRVIASTGNYYISKSGAKIPLSSRDVARVPVATGKIPK
jgi:cell division protein FtsQ